MSTDPGAQRGYAVFTQPKMAWLLLLGFSSGVPLFLTGRTLQAWMTVEGVDLAAIGLFSLVAVPYSLKFAWAPLLDRYPPPLLGRRRGWLLMTQLALFAAIAAMALHDPHSSLRWLAVNALLIAFFSASQDTVYDAYRVDVLAEPERGAGAAVGVLGYRIALLVTGAAALVLADQLTWPTVYLLLATLLLVGVLATLVAPEPAVAVEPPQSMADAVRLPFREFLGRVGRREAPVLLAFVVLYKLGDALAANMATPFLLQAGFAQTDVGAVQGGLGLLATIVGVMAGGWLLSLLGTNRSLLLFGAAQAASNLAYLTLAEAGRSYPLLVSTVLIENLSAGLGTAAFVAFLMGLCNPRFSATQFALLTSLNAVSRDLLVAPAGSLAEVTGWPLFFLLTLAATVPGLALLPLVAPWRRAAPRPGSPRERPTTSRRMRRASK